jgi:hypothetical protein
MDITKIIDTVATVIELASRVVATVEDARPFAENIVKTISGKGGNVTEAELQALIDMANKLGDELEAELPPEDPPKPVG